MTDTLVDHLSALALAHTRYTQKKEELDARRAAFEAQPENAALIAEVQTWKKALDASDEQLRGAAVEQFQHTGDLKPAAGVEITAIRDITPVPHNGCRPPKRRRV